MIFPVVSAGTRLAVEGPLVMLALVICAMLAENAKALTRDPAIPRAVPVLTESAWSESVRATAGMVPSALPDSQKLLQGRVRKSAICVMMVIADYPGALGPELWEGLQTGRLPKTLKDKVEGESLEFWDHHGLPIISSIRQPKMVHQPQDQQSSDAVPRAGHFEHFFASQSPSLPAGPLAHSGEVDVFGRHGCEPLVLSLRASSILASTLLDPRFH